MIALPSRATYKPGERVVIELRPSPAGPTQAIVTHLDQEMARISIPAEAAEVDLGVFGVGGYGVTIGGARTAFDVLHSRWDRPRYGFVVTLTDGVDSAAVSTFFRRLHLTAAQLYDWAYRHSTLMPPTRHYVDPLGQPRDMDVVDEVCRALTASGTVPLGYAAIYAVGHAEAEAWRDSVLLRSSGEPYRLGDDFLVLVDPAEPRWLAHLSDQLADVIAHSDIAGFHLDQYGWPKFATRGDGPRVDLAASFVTMIEAVRGRLPDVPFMFNNVNDFPTHATAGLPQDATYIEVWEPHSTLGDLGALATTAWAARPDHPPILSAYLSCYGTSPEGAATHAAELVMATAFSHGAAHLLLGETGHALTHPYYPTNHVLTPASIEDFARWYDFGVRYGDLLYVPDRVDVTEFYAGGINEDIVLDAGDIPVSTKADAGCLWLRVIRVPEGVVVHIINLVAQDEIAWDAPKQPPRPISGATLALSFVGEGAAVYAAAPDAPDAERLVEVGATAAIQTTSLTAGQSGVAFALPELGAWTVVWIPTRAMGLASALEV